MADNESMESNRKADMTDSTTLDALAATSAAKVYKRLRLAGYDAATATAKVADALGITSSDAGALVGRGVGIIGGSRG